MPIVSEVTTRPYVGAERDLVARLTSLPPPLVFAGQVVRCTNANAREFTHMQRYRIERLAHPARPGVALAVVRNDAGHERIIPSTAWLFGHWEIAR